MEFGGGFEVAVLEQRPGLTVLRLRGEGAAKLAETEPGGHRWQRIPPTEKRGRVHTSTVTVAVLPEPKRVEATLNMAEIRIDTYRGSGAGGQHRNKTDSAVRATHLPTGLVACSESERSQRVNKEQALAALAARLAQARAEAARGARAAQRREQVGSGMRSDKIRTIRLQDDTLTCHHSGKKYSVKAYLKGELPWEQDQRKMS